MSDGKPKAKRQVGVDGEPERAPKRAKSECIKEPESTQPVSEEDSGNGAFLDSLPELEEYLNLDDTIEIDAMVVDVVEEQSGQGKATVTKGSEEIGVQVANKLRGSENQTDPNEGLAKQQSEDDNAPIPVGPDEEIPEVGSGIHGESEQENEKQTIANTFSTPEASEEEENPNLDGGELEDAPAALGTLQSKVGQEPVSGKASGKDDGGLDEKLEIGSNSQNARDEYGGGLANEDKPGLGCSKEAESHEDVPNLQTPSDADGEAVRSQSRTDYPEPMATENDEVEGKEGNNAETEPAETARKAESDVTNVDTQEPQSNDEAKADSNDTAAEFQAEAEVETGIPKRQDPPDVDMVDSQAGANADAASKAEDTSVAQALTKDAEITQSAESLEPCSWCDDFAYGLVGFEKHRPGPMCARCVQQRSCIVKCTGHRAEPLDGFKPESFDFRAAYDSLNPGSGKRVTKTPWCSLCPTPAFFRCATQPATSGHEKSTEPGAVMGCGLMLCETCNILVQACNDLTWVVSFIRSEDPADGSRADVDYLLPGSELCK